MAITGVGAYGNMYENTYKVKQRETDAEKKVNAENKSSLLDTLQDKYSDFCISEGNFSQNQISSQSKGFQGVTISPEYLAKAQNNEKTAKELDEMLGGVESAQKWLENAFKRDGLELVSCGYYIDENGRMGSWSVVQKKENMFDSLAKQSEESDNRIKEKQEKVREQKKADEKKAEKMTGKKQIVKYEFNTTDEQGNKVMDKMSREETLAVMKEIRSQYGDDVIVEFSRDGMAALKESKFGRNLAAKCRKTGCNE